VLPSRDAKRQSRRTNPPSFTSDWGKVFSLTGQSYHRKSGCGERWSQIVRNSRSHVAFWRRSAAPGPSELDHRRGVAAPTRKNTGRWTGLLDTHLLACAGQRPRRCAGHADGACPEEDKEPVLEHDLG
jgi:hypothetical protein